MVHEVQLGKNTRLSYSKINEVLDMPNLIEVQKKSYQWFIEEGLREVFRDISPITDHSGHLVLEIFDHTLEYNPKYSVAECKERDAKYAAPLRVNVRLINTETGEIKEQEIFMGEFPLMTEQGTFIINGAERVIVSQLVRSPGMYYSFERDKTGKPLYASQIIPYRGEWLEYETDSNDVFSVRIKHTNHTKKIPVTNLIRAMGIESDSEILEYFGDSALMRNTLEKDTTHDREEALLEIYKRLRPGEPLNVENAESFIFNMFFDPKRYDLARVGRYKYNKKVALAERIEGKTLAEDVIDPRTGEIIASSGDALSREMARDIEYAGVNRVVLNVEEQKVVVLSNDMVHLSAYVDFDTSDIPFKKVLRSVLEEILSGKGYKEDGEAPTDEEIKEQILAREAELSPKHITIEDMYASINYVTCLACGVGKIDDIDHLGNRRLRSVGELLQNQFRIGLARMERTVRERMTIQDLEIITPQTLINIRPIIATINEFFGSSQLSQFMDQPNPLAELRHKRRISALGPGGLSRDRAGFEVRDVHYSHYGRMCPIETPEGPNIGLITSLATFAQIDEYGFIETPYRKVDKEKGMVTDEIVYMTADLEDEFIIAQANEPLDDEGHFMDKRVSARFRDEILEVPGNEIDYMDVSPRQLVSVVTACIPFLENDDANRALMGSNMQCQAVPLLTTDSAIVGTGMEYKVAHDSGSAVLSSEAGVVEKVSADEIVIKGDKTGEKYRYKMIKFARSNQSTCINQRPIVEVGEHVEKGDIIADGPAMDNGELALGKNILIGFMTWEGYNYEDAVLISEELVKNDVFTSIHIEEYECEARDTKLGPEEITRDISNVSEDTLKDLNEQGIIRIGAEVRAGDILVGKVTPKGETELTAEERLLRAIFGEKAREVRDTSLRVPHGENGIIVDVKVFTRENSELPPGVNKVVRCYIAQKRKISVGDKMAGRHGNKGVVSRVLPQEDMPFLADGTPLQIVLNPLGVPSRMNIGQVLEMHLGYAFRTLSLQSCEEIEARTINLIKDKVEKLHLDDKCAQKVMEILDAAEVGFDKDKLIKSLGAIKALSKEEKESLKEIVNYCVNYKDTIILAKQKLGEDEYIKIATPVFDGAEDENLREAFIMAGLREDFKSEVYDGRTGEKFDNPVTVGVMHYLKLDHLVDDKIHARSTGPYSLVTQQPLGGKAQFGGQRFGEMEVWALEAYGAAYTLQEILTVKSDDIVGRVKTYEAIVKGENIPKAGIPEAFKVLVKELQSLALDIRILDHNSEEIDLIKFLEDDDDDYVTKDDIVATMEDRELFADDMIDDDDDDEELDGADMDYDEEDQDLDDFADSFFIDDDEDGDDDEDESIHFDNF